MLKFSVYFDEIPRSENTPKFKVFLLERINLIQFDSATFYFFLEFEANSK